VRRGESDGRGRTHPAGVRHDLPAFRRRPAPRRRDRRHDSPAFMLDQMCGAGAASSDSAICPSRPREALAVDMAPSEGIPPNRVGLASRYEGRMVPLEGHATRASAIRRLEVCGGKEWPPRGYATFPVRVSTLPGRDDPTGPASFPVVTATVSNIVSVRRGSKTARTVCPLATMRVRPRESAPFDVRDRAVETASTVAVADAAPPGRAVMVVPPHTGTDLDPIFAWAETLRRPS